jgi:heterotetrameric sarcosine oxidase gamma subunit
VNLSPDTAFGSTFGASKPFENFDPKFVTLSERSDIGCVLLNSAVKREDVAESIAVTLGFELPASGTVTAGAGPTSAVWLTPRSWLIFCSLPEEFRLLTRINAAFPDKRVHAAAFSDYLCWLELGGKEAHTLLTSGGFLSFEIDGLKVGQAKRTLLAGIPVVVMRNAADHWTLGVERSRAAYFVGFLRESATQERGVAVHAS